jgi:hypothetical protein
MSEPTINWINELGSKLIRGVTLEINTIPPITQTQKRCLKCNQIFSYERKDECEKVFRQFSSLKKGNLDLCVNCDDVLKKLN